MVCFGACFPSCVDLVMGLKWTSNCWSWNVGMSKLLLCLGEWLSDPKFNRCCHKNQQVLSCCTTIQCRLAWEKKNLFFSCQNVFLCVLSKTGTLGWTLLIAAVAIMHLTRSPAFLIYDDSRYHVGTPPPIPLLCL